MTSMIESNMVIENDDTVSVGSSSYDEGSAITFEMLQLLKIEHGKLYDDLSNTNTQPGSTSQIAGFELLNYLYDVLDNINSEIIKQNKQRIKAKYGSLLPPQAVRNKQQQQYSAGVSGVGDASSQGDRLDNDGFQPVMPKRAGRGMNNTSSSGGGKRGGRDGKGSNRSSGGKSSYSQPYKSESERSSRLSLSSSINDSSTPRQSGSIGGGVLSKLLGADRLKMAINRELNKLSPVNMDIIADSITDLFAGWFLDELNNNTQIEAIRERYNNYLLELWSSMISKSLTQSNMSEVYFKFLRRLITNQPSTGTSQMQTQQPTQHQTIMTCLRAKSSIMAGRLGIWQPGFHELSANKTALLDEIIRFLNSSDYFQGDINANDLAVKVGGAENLVNIQESFSILGLFTKYFMDTPSGRNRKTPSSWDVMLLAIYANFKLINELLYWEPVNLEEVERRVFFTVGFLEDNRGFIQSLDTDFYRDIECELDSIKKCASIPASVKYKLFDCIDNFILMRKSGGGRK